jgi:hypothetical protein
VIRRFLAADQDRDMRERFAPWNRVVGVTLLALSPLAVFALTARAAEPLPRTVEFNRDIRPILSDICFTCHGPDQAKRKAKLRLDTEEGAFAEHDGTRAVVPNRPDKSELLRRIASDDDKERMPPARTGRRLTPHQVALVRRWIEQGAKWQNHWSLIPPHRPALPTFVDNPKYQALARDWTRNAIDHFILDRLAREGLAPSTEAERVTLLRRVTLDLTGLPPTPAEIDVFLNDTSPDAYEKVVDRLLASPRYGERMAIRWIDAARYADTNGYQSDGERFMWRWRDWVIDAYNQNMPFDRFTIEQIAGDLLPNPTLSQRIATGFNRNHRGNAEGGIIPEEYAVEYVADRVETTATVWLGLTMTCARCHDHKFDPIKQKEFYRLFAYFNNVPERGKAIKYGNSPPMIKAPTSAQQDQLLNLEAKLAEAEKKFRAREPELVAAQAAWQKDHPGAPSGWSITNGLAAHFGLDGNTQESVHKTSAARFRDGEASFAAGRLDQALALDGKRFVDAGNVGDFGFYHKFTLAAWIKPADVRKGTIVSRMVDTDQGAGYQVCLHNGKVQVNLVVRWLDDALRVETERPLEADRWYHVAVSYDGSRVADGVKIYVDGRVEKLKVNLDDLNQTFQTKEPLRLGAGGGGDNRFRGLIDDVRVFTRPLASEEAEILSVADTIEAILAEPAQRRTSAQARKLRAYFLERHAPQSIREAHETLRRLRKEHADFVEAIPTTMVMQEMARPRDSYLLIRGVYDRRGEKVEPGVPASLAPLPRGAPDNRLGLARWLVDPANSLTARVAVNRYWQMYFGAGLVRTVEDFGSQGEWPSHPELLDWLATEFVRTGWDVKALQRLIVTSATYRQSSRIADSGLRSADFSKTAPHAIDPDNRWLWRGPRMRLPAEMIRDQALFSSGLLVERLGGPSVKPYQPPGLWGELGDSKYVRDRGPDLYRRSLYTYWKRTVAPPAMITFDAAGRETCIVRETRTNTPLQALNLMNDVTYVEAARALAQRVLKGSAKPEDRIALAFRLVMARPTRPAEQRVLRDGLNRHLERYRADRESARKLVEAGESGRDEKLDIAELAAYTAIASLILNLDEAITKE